MSLDNKSAKTCQIVDGMLVKKVGRINVFTDDDLPIVVKARERYEQAKEKQHDIRVEQILPTFRAEVIAFIAKFGSKPTLCLMNYRDVDLIVDAFNAEQEAIYAENVKVGIEVTKPLELSTSNYANEKRFVDGIKVKQGCDQEVGVIRFYSAESIKEV